MKKEYAKPLLNVSAEGTLEGVFADVDVLSMGQNPPTLGKNHKDKYCSHLDGRKSSN